VAFAGEVGWVSTESHFLIKLLYNETCQTAIDLLFASSGIENEVVEAAEDFEITPNFKVPIAQIGHLIALKLLSKSETRFQDAADLQNLLLVADDTERNRAREAVKLITERGHNRGKD
jgi:predicted nucleotidyltransferase